MPPDVRVVAVTGSAGFIGCNLVVRLREAGYQVHALDRRTPPDDAIAALKGADVIFHLAAAIRPKDEGAFVEADIYGQQVADAVARGDRNPLVVLSSSTRAEADDAHGRSKRTSEAQFAALAARGLATVAIWRLPNVFGKWAKPDYNSAVATFCHRLARGMPIEVDNEDASLALLHIDDLIEQWLETVQFPPHASGRVEPTSVRHTTVGEIVDKLRNFAEGREDGRVGELATDLDRALYATFVSALPEEAFSYPLQTHADGRGRFTEMLRTPSGGQVSYFTAGPGVTRGGHYHHAKVEKFLIVHGEALFRFRHVLTGATHEVRASSEAPVVVESVPGWSHDVTNVGADVMISVLWASEVFDRDRPDTVRMPL